MTITLNGSPYEIEGPLTLDLLLQRIGLEGKPVVVELDQAAILPRDYPATLVKDAARLEIVTLAAGG